MSGNEAEDRRTRQWGVQFNENAMTFCGATGAAEWWWPQRRRMDQVPGKVTILNGSAPGGDLIFIRTADRDEAAFAYSFMVDRGIPASCLKVRAL